MKKKFYSLILALILALTLITPAEASGDTGKAGQINTISAGDWLAAVIDENDTLWMWGSSTYGQLGGEGFSFVPIKVLDDVTSVSCGNEHVAAIRTDGTLWTWGRNNYGQLGDGTTKNSSVPIKVLDNVVAISCGQFYTAAIRTDGTLWMWGCNSYGQLGNGTTEDSAVPTKVLDNVAIVSCGEMHTAAVQTDGSLWAWGRNDYGQLGNGTAESSLSPTTVPIKILDNVIAISCGRFHTAAIKTDNTLWTWGLNYCGQLGNGTTKNSYIPIKVLDNVATVSCDYYYTAATKTDNTLWTWGWNSSGQLGNGTKEDSLIPIKVLDDVVCVNTEYDFAIAVKSDGSVWEWGDGNFQSPIQDTIENSSIPAQVSNLTAKLPNNFALSFSASVTSTAPTAYATSYSILVDGKAVAFDAYALRDEDGNDTNYLKLRDVAHVLNGSAAQFDVGWDGASGSISITTGTAYTSPNGSEMSTPFSGDQTYTENTSAILINGTKTDLSAITLTDAGGGAYTYFKLRDLGQYLGFHVDWDSSAGAIVIDTTKPYSA